MLPAIAGLLLGLICLWRGTDWAINNAIRIAAHYRLSDIVVGMGILAIGSDLPEFAIAIDAGIKGYQGVDTSGMIVGSSIGSAFAQIGLVMGLVGFSGLLLIGRESLLRHGSVLLGSILVLFVVSYDLLISRMDSLILLICFAVYFFLLLTREPAGPVKPSHAHGMIHVWLGLVGGIITVVAASELTVYSVVTLASGLQISQTLIALFLVGIGTSLPELSISLSALSKKKTALSVGNIFGSNIFDTLVPIGAAALIYPVVIDTDVLQFDLPVLAGLSLLVLFFFYYRKGLQRREAMILLAVYLLYALANIWIR